MTTKEAMTVSIKPWYDVIKKYISVKDANIFNDFVNALINGCVERLDSHHWIPAAAGREFKMLKILKNDVKEWEIKFRFDEQQADPIHRMFSLEEIKKELNKLFNVVIILLPPPPKEDKE